MTTLDDTSKKRPIAGPADKVEALAARLRAEVPWISQGRAREVARVLLPAVAIAWEQGQYACGTAATNPYEVHR